jgi:thioredoxin 1
MQLKVLISGLFLSLSIPAMHALEKQDVLWQLSKRNTHMVEKLTKDTIEQSKKPLIIKAYATWCPHCVKMEPVFKQLEKDLGQKYTFAELDTDKSRDLSIQLNIKSLPTFIFIKDKREVGREMGSMSQENLKKLIVKYLG